MMRTIQITIDEALLDKLDQELLHRGRNRSALIRQAIQEYLAALRRREREEQHRRGYTQKPVKPGEFDIWEREQVWGDL